MRSRVSTEEAKERINAALDAIDAAHLVLRDTSSDVVGNTFRVDIAERLETQERTNRGLMYRFFGEIADPPDGTESIGSVRDRLWLRLRITPSEVVRRFRLAARIRPRRSLTGAAVPPELAVLAAAVEGGVVGEDHIRAVCRAVDVLPSCVSHADVANAERTLVEHATEVDSGLVIKLGQRIADYLNPDGNFTEDDRARRRGLRLGPQGPDGMSLLRGLIDPEARAYFEAIEAAVRPGRHLPGIKDGDPESRDDRTPDQRSHDALKFGLETAIASGKLGVHRGHPITVIATTTLAELDQAAHAVNDESIPMPAPARTGGGSRLPMQDLIRLASNAINYLAVFEDHTSSPPPTRDSSATPGTTAAPTRTVWNPAIAVKSTIARTGPKAAGPTRTSCTSAAAYTMAGRAAASFVPRSLIVGDSAGQTAPAHRRSTTLTIPTNCYGETSTHLKTTGRCRMALPQSAFWSPHPESVALRILQVGELDSAVVSERHDHRRTEFRCFLDRCLHIVDLNVEDGPRTAACRCGVPDPALIALNRAIAAGLPDVPVEQTSVERRRGLDVGRPDFEVVHDVAHDRHPFIPY
jgi:hypothetical protein